MYFSKKSIFFMKIRFTNLYKLIPEKHKIKSKINFLIKNAKFVGGQELENFEKNFSKFVGTKYCVGVGNGTDALEIAVKSLKLPKGSEIIVPNNTWISTAEAVVNNGYKVVFCDVNLDDYSICIKSLSKKINKKTSAIIVVHLYGNPANMLEIKKIVKSKKIKIIEDCAQAHGSKILNKHVGTFGDISTFSFFPGKNLGAFGDGGAILTNSKSTYIYCLRCRNHGSLKKYDHKFSGRNSRLDTIQASILNIKLKNYNKNVLFKRSKLALRYFKNLKSLNQIKLFNLNKKNSSSFHQFVIRTKFRDKLKKFLKKKNIDTMIHYPYMLNELNFFQNKNVLKKSNNLGNNILSLPISEEHTIKQIDYVSNTIKEFFRKKST